MTQKRGLLCLELLLEHYLAVTTAIVNESTKETGASVPVSSTSPMYLHMEALGLMLDCVLSSVYDLTGKARLHAVARRLLEVVLSFNVSHPLLLALRFVT